MYPRRNFLRITNVLCILRVIFLFDLIDFKFKQLISTLWRIVFNIDLVSSWHKLINQIFTRLAKSCEVSSKFKKLNIYSINIVLETNFRKFILNFLLQALYFLCLPILVLFINHLNQYFTYFFINIHKWALLKIHTAIWNWKRLILSIVNLEFPKWKFSQRRAIIFLALVLLVVGIKLVKWKSLCKHSIIWLC